MELLPKKFIGETPDSIVLVSEKWISCNGHNWRGLGGLQGWFWGQSQMAPGGSAYVRCQNFDFCGDHEAPLLRHIWVRIVAVAHRRPGKRCMRKHKR